jgi:hypothetical protein
MEKIAFIAVLIGFIFTSTAWGEVSKFDCTHKMISHDRGWNFSYFSLELDRQNSSIRLNGDSGAHQWTSIYYWDHNFIMWFVFRPEDYYAAVYSLDVKTGYLDYGNVTQYREDFIAPLVDQGVNIDLSGYRRCVIRNPFLLLPPAR